MSALSLAGRVRRSIERRGWRATASQAGAVAWTRFRRSRAGRLHVYVGEAAYDRVHGVNTRGILRHESVGAFENAFRYEATRRSRVKETLRAMPARTGEFTFVDIGCGRGLVLLLAARQGYRRIVGIELSTELCDIATENAQSYRPHTPTVSGIEVVNADATTWELPAEPLVVYVYNSFAGPAFEVFADNLSRSLRTHPRELYLIYMFPESRVAVDAIPELETCRETRHYVLYRSTR